MFCCFSSSLFHVPGSLPTHLSSEHRTLNVMALASLVQSLVDWSGIKRRCYWLCVFAPPRGHLMSSKKLLPKRGQFRGWELSDWWGEKKTRSASNVMVTWVLWSSWCLQFSYNSLVKSAEGRNRGGFTLNAGRQWWRLSNSDLSQACYVKAIRLLFKSYKVSGRIFNTWVYFLIFFSYCYFRHWN